ncbi:MAG TPA: glycerol-3-phosphate 1-O-acyltransferase PlsY [Vicinamibacterales bacterium]|jgi:glycerol-3-phosphate acyltransferase PlsY|nr:glycerol-3-phosphate 1-O-acyltransferase PlsY [Vicinamibacterales bacterium]
MVVAALTAYGIGSIPFALLLARFRGTDLRRIGSGNLGAANVMRASGATAGVIVAVLDMLKGATAVVIAQRLTDEASAPALAGLAAVIGHVYPLWLRFRGGKGVATACGVFAVLTPAAIAPALGIFVVVVAATRYVSLGSVLASVALPPIVYVMGADTPVVVAALSIAALIVFRHRSNLGRLRAGTERRLGTREAVAR